MASKFESFKALHTANNLFVLPNAWDAGSASVLQESKYAAVGTSSAAVAASLGYTDGENMSFSEYLFVIQRIAATVNIPVTVDFEMGYGKTPEAIYANTQKLIEAGVVGINIEDSVITNGNRSLKDTAGFAKTVEFLRRKLDNANQELFINVRCDAYLLAMKNEAAGRLKAYEAAGADGIFLPFISDEKDIANAIAQTKLPLNVMAMPGLPSLQQLNELGVKRVSMGPFLHNKTYSAAKELAQAVLEQYSLNSIL
jgi:2-methylisocitrate lyase-like PEP mutase family enzyme